MKYLFFLLFSLQSCAIPYSLLLVEDPGFELQFVDEQNRVIPNLEMHYMQSKREIAHYQLQKYQVIKNDDNGIVKLPKKRGFYLMFINPTIYHDSTYHVWTWCVSNNNYLPQTGIFKLDQSNNYKKVVLKKASNNYQCVNSEQGHYLEPVCKKNCPKIDVLNLRYADYKVFFGHAYE